MNLTTLLRPAALGAALFAASFAAQAQIKDVIVDGKGEIPYAVDGRNVVARSGAGLCWRTGYWTPAAAGTAMAGKLPVGCECDSDIVAKDKCAPAAAAPTAAPAPAPAAPAAAAPAAPAPTAKKITLSSKALFGFNKAVLTPQGKAAIDREVLARLREVGPLQLVTVSGHTDRLGSQQYNQALSERRAKAVKDYLVTKGVPADKIDVIGYGKTQPVPGVKCDDKLGRKKLIECLEPHRRVEVEIKAS
ncbi:OmpA family protein [Azoarcus sp. KH32C]|uniref:OmpA family protein n=1 Tax=Azoarcus sp. KH32C TaxID=748247 RepID=UPI0002386773|nr:OmpA family protein [Azoarcus sp. KH32C]BAL25846.1 outer membrane protein [Azoarcus sp. KH32C]